MRLQDFLVTDALVPQVRASEPGEAIAELIDALVAAGAVPAELRQELLDQFMERERSGSTGFGKGVAVPHVKHERLPRMVGTIGISPAGIDFNALDREPVYSIVMLLSPRDAPDQHLQAMENIFSNLQNAAFRRLLRQANTPQALAELIQEADTQQLPS
jgi:PTS system fructose-specific IIA component/PTS system nitrogen regulatory IIA component